MEGKCYQCANAGEVTPLTFSGKHADVCIDCHAYLMELLRKVPVSEFPRSAEVMISTMIFNNFMRGFTEKIAENKRGVKENGIDE
jgi:hypothetical protein